jgi:MoaD family protein
MPIQVHFYSYFKDLTGMAQATVELPSGATLGDLLELLFGRHPRLAAMRNSMLTAVGVEYQGRNYVLKPGDEVSLFPPVQGG